MGCCVLFSKISILGEEGRDMCVKSPTYRVELSDTGHRGIYAQFIEIDATLIVLHWR